MIVKRLTVVMLVCLTLSACGGVDPDSPLGQRKAIFKQMLKTSEDLGGMLRGRIAFDGPRFTEGAIKLDALAHEPWKHFPQVKESDQTSATDNVWKTGTLSGIGSPAGSRYWRTGGRQPDTALQSRQLDACNAES